MKPRPSRVVALVLAALVFAGAALAGPKLVTRALRHRALRRAIAALEREDAQWRATAPGRRNPDTSTARALVAFDDPEAVLALVRSFHGARPDAADPSAVLDPTALVEAVELFALEPEPRDPRVREALEAFAHDDSLDVRFWASYLLRELEQPRHAREPEGFAAPGARVHAPWPEALEAVRSLARLPIDGGPPPWEKGPPHLSEEALRELPPLDDTPWRALVRVARARGARVTVEDGRVRLVPELAESGIGSVGQRTVRPWYVSNEQLTVHAEPPLRLALDPGPLHGADPEKAMRLIASWTRLELFAASRSTFVAFDPDRKAFLARLVASFRDGKPGDADDPRLEGSRTGLLDFDEPEAFATLLEDLLTHERDLRFPPEANAIRGAAIFAATSQPDARIRALVARLCASESRHARFVGHYVAEELRQPSLPEAPPELAPRVPIVGVGSGSTAHELASLARATGLDISLAADESPFWDQQAFAAPPWRAVLRAAARKGEEQILGLGYVDWKLSVEGRRVTLGHLEPDRFRRAWDDPEDTSGLSERVRRALVERPVPDVPWARRGLIALAALEGCELRESPRGELSFEPIEAGK